MKQKQIAMLVAFLLVGAVLGAMIGWQLREGDVEDAYQEGIDYQKGVEPTAVTPASVSMSLNASEFNHTTTVDGNGAVGTEADSDRTLTISNDDETRTAKNPKLMLKSSVTGTEGLHDNLETDYTQVSITIGGVTKVLYKDGEYLSGVDISDLGAGDEAEITVTFTLEEAVDGTFQDGQEYDCNLYLYQPNANYDTPISFTVTT